MPRPPASPRYKRGCSDCRCAGTWPRKHSESSKDYEPNIQQRSNKKAEQSNISNHQETTQKLQAIRQRPSRNWNCLSLATCKNAWFRRSVVSPKEVYTYIEDLRKRIQTNWKPNKKKRTNREKPPTSKKSQTPKHTKALPKPSKTPKREKEIQTNQKIQNRSPPTNEQQPLPLHRPMPPHQARGRGHHQGLGEGPGAQREEGARGTEIRRAVGGA